VRWRGGSGSGAVQIEVVPGARVRVREHAIRLIDLLEADQSVRRLRDVRVEAPGELAVFLFDLGARRVGQYAEDVVIGLAWKAHDAPNTCRTVWTIQPVPIPMSPVTYVATIRKKISEKT
jgi:hypothetical protein